MSLRDQGQKFRDAFLSGDGLADGKSFVDIQSLFKTAGNPSLKSSDSDVVQKFIDKCADVAADSAFFSPPLITDDEKDAFKDTIQEAIKNYADTKVDANHSLCPPVPGDLPLKSTLLEAIQHAVDSPVGRCQW